MNTQTNDISTNRVDAKSLATLIIELNIVRRNSRAYPKGHPVIAASLAKVLRVYEELLNKHDELILGVTSDTLMVDDEILEKSNLVYRDFSRVLFERGIGALQFQKGLTIEELNNFTIILGLKREQIYQHGGIEQVWVKAHIKAITVRAIRYDLFQAAEGEDLAEDRTIEASEGLWERFARELMHDGESLADGNDTSLDPKIVAEVLNQQFANGGIDEAVLQGALNALFSSPRGESKSSSETHSAQPQQKVATLISNLTPELRRQFLGSSFGTNDQDQQAAAELIVSNLSDSVILETLEDINDSRLSVSPVVLGLLQRLGQNVRSPHNIPEEISEEDNFSRKMKSILRENESEEFVPDDYQKELNNIISSEQFPRLNMEDVNDLLTTFENSFIESSIGQILMNLIREGVQTPEELELLLENLGDLFGFVLQTGDYGQLNKMIDQMTDDTFSVEIRYRMQDVYGRREFLEEILNGLTIWGKPRYGDIRSLIHKIGGVFVEAILDRLSEENNMSLRRFYMDSLIEMGSATQAPIISRLHDKRWYFLRNLLIILSAQNDQSIVPSIRPLLRTDDLRLRHEVLKTLLHFHDHQAETRIVEDLDSQNQELRTAALQLAELCRTPAVASRLADMLATGGFSQIECERKSVIVHALGEIGRSEVLPELAKILGSWSLLHSRQLTQLKKDIIHSLPKYPSKVSRPVLERIAAGSGDIARLAAETLITISGKPA